MEKLIELSKALLKAIEQKQFFQHGYSQGSASISEVNKAHDDEHEAYEKLWDYIKKLEQYD